MPDDDLLARIERLEEDNRRLSELVEQLSTRDTPEPDDTPVNRRGLLKRTAAIALGVTTAGTASQLLNPAPAAATIRDFLIGTANFADYPTSYRCDESGWPGLAAINGASEGDGFLGRGNAIGVIGTTKADYWGDRQIKAGVLGTSDQGTGVLGESSEHVGVRGKGPTYGVVGEGTADGSTGVGGSSVNGVGVEGYSENSVGVFGQSVNAHDDLLRAGVYGLRVSMARDQLMFRSAGVFGESSIDVGVHGASTSNDGVVGYSTSARGGVFTGGAAAVRLSPGTRANPPAAGETGDLYVDSTGRLWYCRQGGSTANWVTLVG